MLSHSLLYERILKTIGAFILTAYLVVSVNSKLLPNSLVIPFIFLFGPVVILTVLHVFSKITFPNKYRSYIKNAVLLMVIAFSILTILSVVQQTGLYRYKSLSITNESSQTSFFLFNSIQLGFDLVFDVFYSISILLFSFCFISLNAKSILGWFGLISSISLMVLNFIAFPNPPSSVGLIDVGPITIIWWLLLVIYVRKHKNLNNGKIIG